jgi:hypothetical protein
MSNATAAAAASGPQKKRARTSWSEPLAALEQALATTAAADLKAAEKELTAVLSMVKRRRMEMGSDALLEKMVAATCAGEEGQPSTTDTRKLLAVLREGKSDARCSFSEEGSSVSHNTVEVELEGFFTMGKAQYEISGAVTNQDGSISLSEAVTVEGVGYFCEDDFAKLTAGTLEKDDAALRWAKLAGVEMSEGDVLRTIIAGLSVMLATGQQTGNAKDDQYGVDPVKWILDWVGEALGAKYSSGAGD